jgi:hypothetical protein
MRLPTGNNVLITVLISTSAIFADDLFSTCRFHFGTPDGIATGNSATMAQVDYLTAWAGSAENYNLNPFFQTCKNNNKTPVVVSYIIAFTARRDWSLLDCNVDPTNNLCKRGADFIRQQKPRIMSQYSKYAGGANSSFGSSQWMVWCMEPDFSQYADAGQNSGGLTVTQCGALMNEILDTIKKYCPKAVFSMDISPWKDTTWQKNWFQALPKDRFTFINTSGGQARADQTFISDNWSTALPTWAWVFKAWGKPLITDAGYGAGGSNTGHDVRWDNVANLTARIKDGVLGVAQVNPASDWGSTISSIRSQLPTPPKCPAGESGVMEPEKAGNQPHSSWLTALNCPGLFECIDMSGKVRYSRMMSGKSVSIRSLRRSAGQLPRGIYILQWNSGTLVYREKLPVHAE